MRAPLTLGLAAAALAACSVVYPIQYVPTSPLTVDYQSDQYSFQVVELTPTAAREANALFAYQPRRLPDAFSSLGAPAPFAGSGAILATTLGENVPGCEDGSCFRTSQLARNLEGQGGFSEFTDPPRSLPQPYRVGTGDVFTITVTDVSGAGTGAPIRSEAVVDYLGNIFIADIGEVNVGGKTDAEARQAVADAFRDARLSQSGTAALSQFNSQNVVVASPGRTTQLLPITNVPITLRDAYLRFSSGLEEDARRQAVVLRRGGRNYPIRGEAVLRKAYGDPVYLRDGDEVQIIDERLAGVPSAAVSPDVLALRRSQFDERRYEEEGARADRAEASADEQLAIARAAEVRQREAEQRQLRAATLAEQAEARASREEARRDAAEARAAAAESRLQAAETRANREEGRRDAAESRAAREEARRDAAEARAAAAEARAAAAEARDDARLRLSQDTLDVTRERNALDRAQARIDLGADGRDRVYIGGEVGQQQALPLPYDRHLSLAEALYGSGGLEPVTADPADIYVVRARSSVAGQVDSYIFHFDHANLANTAAMTVFEMRPDDLVVVRPRAVTNFSRFISQILPTFSGLVSGARLAAG